MPQLDQFTYLTQFTWLCFFYMTFYILLFNDGLPKISRILKLRSHLCASSKEPDSLKQSEGSLEDADDKSYTSSETQNVIFRTLHTSISYLNSSVNGAFHWCFKSVDSLNTNQLRPMNKTYLRSIGEMSLSELVKNNALEASAPSSFSSRSSISSELSLFLWALRVQSLCSNTAKKKKRK